MKKALRSKMLMAFILALTPIQKTVFGTNQRSLTDIPPKPETEKYYAVRAEKKRVRRAAKRAENIHRAKLGKIK